MAALGLVCFRIEIRKGARLFYHTAHLLLTSPASSSTTRLAPKAIFYDHPRTCTTFPFAVLLLFCCHPFLSLECSPYPPLRSILPDRPFLSCVTPSGHPSCAPRSPSLARSKRPVLPFVPSRGEHPARAVRRVTPLLTVAPGAEMDSWRVAVLGDGGVGKTALAVQVSSPSLDAPAMPMPLHVADGVACSLL